MSATTQKTKASFQLTAAAVKKAAKAGAWRRGYQLYKQGNVLEIALTPEGVEAKVKGNFKSHYTTKLLFTEKGVQPECNCPLEDPWCKHSVAVGFIAAQQHFWETFWNQQPQLDQPPSPFAFDPSSNFHFEFDAFKQTNKAVGIRVFNKVTQSPVRHAEAVLKEAMNERGPDGRPIKFTPLQKKEFSILQLLTKVSGKQGCDRQGWFYLPVNLCNTLMPMLGQVSEVTDKHGNPLFFSKNTLKLNLHLHAGTNGMVTSALHWKRGGNLPEEWPLEEVDIIHKEVIWGLHVQTFYQLDPPLSRLPKALTKSSFVDHRDSEAGKLLFEELPRLRKVVDVDSKSLVEQLKVNKAIMRPHLSVELVDPAALRLRVALSFLYGENKVPYSPTVPNNQYVSLSANAKKGSRDKEALGYVQRELEKENEAYDRIVGMNLFPMQTNQFQAEGDDAIDVYNNHLKRLEKDGWIIQKTNEGDMKVLKASDASLQMKVRLEFDETVSNFLMESMCMVGKQQVDLEEVQGYLISGKKYFYMNGIGFIEIPLARMLQYNRTIQAFEAETVGPDKLQIPTYKAGLIQELVEQGVKLSMSRKFKEFWDVMTAGKAMKELEISDNVNADLRSYQMRGFHWLWFLYSYGLNGILADDMGLGKTLQALVTIQKARDIDGPMPTLIVCPTSVVYNWQNEIKKFTPELTCINLTGSDRFDLYPVIKRKEVDIVITSYAIMRRDINALKNYPFRFVILDESQHIKNYESQTAKAAKMLNAQHKLALSGTPIENRLSELWSVFDFLMPDFLEGYPDFRRRYIVPIEERGSEDAERRLKKQVFPFILRRMKRDVLKELPPKLELIQYCDLTDNQYDLYQRILEKTREEIMDQAAEQGGKLSHNTIFTALTRLRQLCNHPSLVGPQLSEGLHESGKFDALKDMLVSAIENGHRILLFSQFVEMLKIIQQWLKRKDIPFELLTGQTKNRQEAVDNFNNNPNIPIFLASLKAGGTGLNLTGADFVIHYDPWWNPAAEDQATDRVHRIGQTKNVFVYRLITRGTVEEKIIKLQNQKRDLVDSIISADRSMGKSLSLEDLKDILSTDM